MNPALALYPMIALVAWTFVVLLMIPRRRFAAGRQRLVRADDFKYGESENVPPEVRIPNRNLMNLLEMPVLFYLACLTMFVTGKVDAWGVGIAWLYVAVRIVHSLVHLTYNDVYHRLSVFAFSNVVLIVLWVRLAVAL